MIATATTSPTTAPAIQTLFFEGLPVGVTVAFEVGEMVGLGEAPRVFGVVEAARYREKTLHDSRQGILSTDIPGVPGLWSNTVIVAQLREGPLHQ
jgi:hypothetical protein